MNLLEESWQMLFPDTPLAYQTKIKFSGKFSDYNANIKLYSNILELSLCKKWQHVDKEITLGLVQSLLLKLFKKKINTLNIDFYNNFVRHLHIAIPKNNIEPYLEESFNRVNEKYFFNAVETPNLVWGSDSRRKLGCYDFKSDTITMSTLFKDAPKELLDYVMYHEMLHKHHKFSCKDGRNLYHSSKFRKEEKKFENAEILEKQLGRLSYSKKPSLLQKLFDF